MQLITNGMYRVVKNTDEILKVKDHPELDSKYVVIGNQLGNEITRKIISQITQMQASSRISNQHEINFTISLKKDKSSEDALLLQWKDSHHVEIYLAEKENKDKKTKKILFNSIVDVAAKIFEKNFQEFKQFNQDYEFFCYGNIDGTVKNQTLTNHITFMAWKTEKRRVVNNDRQDQLTIIFYRTLIFALGVGIIMAKYFNNKQREDLP